jgi:hypothetical protein
VANSGCPKTHPLIIYPVPNKGGAMVDVGSVFPANDPVPVSGIYGAVHEGYHLHPHKVFCLKDQRFPPCITCGDKVEFQFEEKLLYVLEHESFKS